MSSLDPKKMREQELVRLFLEKAPISKTYGMQFNYDDEGRAIFDLPYNPNFDHALGGIHGGVLATMLDNAGWFTVAPHFDCWIATVEFQVRLLEPVKNVHLQAKGKIIRLGKTVSVAEMEIRDPTAKLIATGSGTFAVTSIPFKL